MASIHQEIELIVKESKLLLSECENESTMTLYEYTDANGGFGLQTKAGSKFPKEMLDEWALSTIESKKRIIEINKLQRYMDDVIAEYKKCD